MHVLTSLHSLCVLPQALAAALGLSFSGLVGTACAAAALSVAGLWALMGLAVAAGALH